MKKLCALTLLTATGCLADESVTSSDLRDKAKLDKEKFMYIVSINSGGTADPDAITIVGVDPEDENFGKIIRRVDMPNVGDELHHFNYNHDQTKLIVPGLFSGRMHVYDLSQNPKRPALRAVREDLVPDSGGYIIPHSVIAQHDGTALVTMIGSANDPSTLPGGIVEIDSATGEFKRWFGYGPERDAETTGPKWMYDYHYNVEQTVGVSTTFGSPAQCGGGINPGCLGDEVAVWDHQTRRVTQRVFLGTNSGALESRWVETPGSTFGYTNTPGTHGVWLWEDEDRNGIYTFHQVLGPEDGLLIPVDMLLSSDFRYMYITNWFGNTVQQFDITDRYHPRLVSTVNVPHPNMVRLSRDGSRLYVTNSLLSTWDNDTRFGDPRNTDYGLWLFNVTDEGMTSYTTGGGPILDYDNIQKKTSVGPMGPHMMLFDPGVKLHVGEH